MTTTVIVTLVAETCCNCAVVFGITEGQRDRLRRTGDWFYCPNGHRQHYTKTEADLLKERLARVEQERDRARANAVHYRDQADAEERAHRATKGQVAKLRKRVANGVCPCCNRTFANVGRHMKTKHPDYGDGNP